MNKYLQPQKYRLAYQSNNIIRTALDMSILQYRIYHQALSELHTSMSEFPTTLIPASSFIKWLSNGESYEAVHAAVSGLAYKVLDLVPIKEKSTRTHKIPLMAEVEYVTGERMIRLTFNEKAAPYLLQLKGDYTITEIEPVLRLKSANAMHLYNILHSYSGKGKSEDDVHQETISLDQLKQWLLGNTTQYPIFTEFNRRVMKPILMEFEAIGYGATWKPSKTGKKTTGITCTIPRVRHHLVSSDTTDVPQLATAPATTALTVTKQPQALMQGNRDSTPRATGFDKFLVDLDQRLKTAYERMTAHDGDQIDSGVAQKIIKHVAGSEAMTRVLLKARHEVAGVKLNDKPAGTTRAGYIVNAMKSIGLVLA